MDSVLLLLDWIGPDICFGALIFGLTVLFLRREIPRFSSMADRFQLRIEMRMEGSSELLKLQVQRIRSTALILVTGAWHEVVEGKQ